MPLSRLPARMRARIISISGGSQVKSRLTSLGILPGTTIEVIENPKWGPILVAIGPNRLALGRGIAEKILVA